MLISARNAVMICSADTWRRLQSKLSALGCKAGNELLQRHIWSLQTMNMPLLRSLHSRAEIGVNAKGMQMEASSSCTAPPVIV